MITDTPSTRFSFPFTLDDFRKDILEVVLHYMRVYEFVTGCNESAVFSAYGIDPEGVDFHTFYPVGNAKASAVELGLRYESVKDMKLAQTLERMYEFAYEGRIDSGFESMDDESCFTFVSALIVDAHESMLAHEWLLRGSDAGVAVYRCRQVADLANARNILEGGESYFPYFSPTNVADSSDGLAIRQMALLAGMEEMSIRAAANPKRAKPLKTASEGKNTFVLIADAKEWLQSKGLYVPVTYHFRDAFFDMRSRGFKSSFELNAMLIDRFEALAKENGAQVVLGRLSPELGAQFDQKRIKPTVLEDGELLDHIAVALDLPSALLNLRAQQLLAKDRLNQIDYLIEAQIGQE